MRLIRFFSVLLLCGLVVLGCGRAEESDTEELVGTYNLFKAEVKFVDQPMQVLVPPTISGTMTISSDQTITQTITVYGTTVYIEGTFEILEDENVMLVDNETSDLISKITYTYTGDGILTTTVDVGTYIEKDFWQKL